MKNYYYFLSLLMCICFSCKKDSIYERNNIFCESTIDESKLRLNEIQLIGSHNSYRQKTYEPILAVLQSFTDFLPEENDPLNEWEYDHLRMRDQLDDFNVQCFELDLYHDPQGGIFSNRAAHFFIGESIASGIPAYDDPGLKVLHISDVDYRTHYVTFIDALNELLTWSNSHPNHLPIFIMLELKETRIPLPGFANVKNFTPDAKAGIAAELLEVFDENQLITPKDIRGNYSTLYEAIQTEGWPNLEETRGKILFFALSENEIDEVIFGTNGSLVTNDNHIVKTIDDPESNFLGIKNAIEMGFIVRTRADSGTSEARSGKTARRDLAISSGAQLIYTDYYQPDPRHVTEDKWTDYHFQWPLDGAKARVFSTDCYLMN